MLNDNYWFASGYMWIFWLLIIFIWVVLAIGYNRNKKQDKQWPALDKLVDRYSRGEINHEEFEKKRKELTD